LDNRAITLRDAHNLVDQRIDLRLPDKLAALFH
jgi:hypothetical protein